MSPFIISMRTAAVSGVITFFLGIVAAKLVISMKNDYWKMTIDGILTLPMVLPPTVAGFFLLYIFGVQGPVGSFFLECNGISCYCDFISFNVSLCSGSIRTSGQKLSLCSTNTWFIRELYIF